MTADLHDFGRQLDELIEAFGSIPASALVAALEGRVDLLRHAAGAPERAVRARRAADLAAQREAAVSLVATACHLTRDHVSNILRGEATSYGSRRAEVLEEAAKHPALADELRALTRAAEARAKAAQQAGAPAPAKKSGQPLLLDGKVIQ